MQWIVPFCISVLFVMGKHQTKAFTTCINCTNCPNVTDEEDFKQCNLGCAIWKNKDGVVERGCSNEVPADAVNLKRCNQIRCNGDSVLVCHQCSTLEDCEEFVCEELKDECYASRTDDHRGCTSDGIYTNGDDFETCSSNNCNRVARCVVCNSNNEADADCLEDPDSFSKPCKGHGLATEDENCYRYEVNKEKFQLGCTSAQDLPEDCNINTCKKCGADDCNRAEFQTCYDCDDCQTIDELLLPVNCADYDSTCLVAYDLTSKNTTRKCTDGLDPIIYGDIFYECSEPNCNGFEFPTHRQCYQNDDLDMSYCTYLNATRCFSQKGTGESTFKRGCDTDPEFDDCHEFVNCLVCDSDGCNKDETEVQVQCAVCSNAEECREPKQEKCDQAKFYDGCYMYQGTEGALEKGCLNELNQETEEVYKACTTQNDPSCQKCTGEFCNEMHCFECNSRDGAECVAGKGNDRYELCPTGDKCRMFVDDEGYTVRGCSRKFKNLVCDNELCQEDDRPASNVGLFPKEAMKCYKCDEDCDTTKPEQLDYCTQNGVSGCYYQFDGNHITSRGCLSEVTFDCGTDPSCHECIQEEGEVCNSVEPWDCYNCSASNGTDCVGNDAMTCKTVVNCAIYVDGNEVKRTCIDDLDFCDPNSDKCCKGNKCNDNDICATCPDGKCYEVCSDKKPNKKCFRYQNQSELQLGCIDNKPDTCDTDAGHCHQCDANLCNEAELAECFTCATDCSTVDGGETKLCSNPKDTCLIGTDQNEVVIRGCTADFNLDDLLNYEICSGAACNREILGTSCYQCKNCTQLQDKLPETCPVQLFTGCYTVQNLESGTIDRGCVSDSGFVDCKENMNCAVCSGAKCNTHEVRNNPLWCSTCSGQNCLDYTPAEQCQNGTGLLIDRCVTFTAFGVTSFKGCLSDGIPEELQNDCYDTQSFCKFCNKDYCNTPDLSCFICSTLNDGIECISNPIALGKTNCTANGVCFTNVEDGHLHRGCYNDQDAIDLCTNSPTCESCNEPDCNTHILPENRISCQQCDGVGCQASELEPSDSKPCLVYREDQFCYTYAEDENTVQRGCSNDQSAPECDSDPCVGCPDSGCNNQETVQPNQLSCIQCSSNSACEGQAFGTPCTKDQLLGRSDQCYTLFFRGLVIEKGCLSDLPSNHTRYEDCLEGNEDVCETCPESNCNRGMALCYKCNSKENNDCSELASTSQYVSKCLAECLTLVDSDGYTQRGCVEDFSDACENTSQCNTCQGILCNAVILPEDRQRCYVCQGSQPECLNPTPGLVKACPLYKPNDECYTHFKNSTWVQRDCLSSLKEDETCGDGCVECQGEGCNGQLAYQLNSLSCVTCEGEACSGVVNGEQCSKQILLGRQDHCYKYTDGVTVSKGCLSDLDEGSKIKEECKNRTGGLCSLCSHKDCNGDGFDCISCDSSRNPECVEWMSPDSPDMLETCESRKCVTFIDAAGYTHKGCSNETTSCKQGDTDCFECDKSMCNNEPFPEDRLRCHKCDDCKEPTADRPTACSKYSSDESCFTLVIGESITRGCQSDTELKCTPTDICLTCSSNGCNDHPYEFDSPLSCIHCNGTRDCQGSSNLEPCQGSLQLGSTDQCYSLMVNGEIIQKGCRRSFPECSEEEYCELCSCDGCNLVSTNSKKIVCADCEGEHCGNELDTVDTCEDVACISYVSKEGVVSRGCLKDFEQFCSSYGSKHETCYESLCNKNIFPSDRIKCYRCENCGTDLGSPEICPTYLERDGCYTAFSNDGSTVSRGCISDLKTTCFEPLCFSCGEAGCNDQNQLDLTTTEDPESTSTSTEASSTSTEEGTTSDAGTSTSPEATSTTPEEGSSTSTEASSTSTEEGTTSDAGTSTSPEATSTTTEAGSSSSTEATSTTPEEGGSTSDGSTSTVSEESTTTTPTSACIKCAESNGIACAWGFQPNSAEQCPTDAESGCFTCRQSDGRIVRGCSTEQAQSACSSESIVDCAGDGCNNENQRTQRCAICDRNCDGPNASYQEKTCSGIVEYANRGCYLLRNQHRIVTERGCVSTLGDDRKRDCENSRDQCDICFSDGCNSAMIVRVLNGLVTAALVVGVVRSKLF